MSSSDLHQALMEPEAYPDETGPIEFRETHISRLYLTPGHVYKIKKPVDFGFLNFTTLDRRRFYCQEEVRLNRRFCPDTYLRVTEIRREEGRIMMDGRGEVIDYAVVMNRLPENLMLDNLIEAGAPLAGEMERLGKRIARLHRDSESSRGEGGRSNLETVRRNCRENFSQTAPFVGSALCGKAQDLCAGFVETFLERHEPLLLKREDEGHVLDGHGDLHAEHVCMTDPIRIFDCIEFSRRFRIADVAADLAFLLMDLEFRNRRDLSALLLASYQGAAGGDPDLERLLPLYKLYRAWVRGKVESLLSSDREADSRVRQDAEKRARSYFNLALGYICPRVLVLTCGMMGVGKTTLGQGISRALGAFLLRSDVLRKELAGLAPSERVVEDFGLGLYSSRMNRRTYDLLQERTREALAEGSSVVADASFARREERNGFRRLAARQGVSCLILYMTCDEQTAIERLDRRQEGTLDASDGRRELFGRQKDTFETPGEERDVIMVDTSKDVDYNVNFILAEIIERAGVHP